MALILNKSQAEAVYSAMCVLNNVSANIERVRIPCGGGIGATIENSISAVCVTGEYRGENTRRPPEIYADQSAFATAYGLEQG